MAEGGADFKSQLRRHYEEVGDELIREHVALRGIIDERLRSIAERQRAFLAKRIQELSDPQDDTGYLSNGIDNAEPNTSVTDTGDAAVDIIDCDTGDAAGDAESDMEIDPDIKTRDPHMVLGDTYQHESFVNPEPKVDYAAHFGVHGQAIGSQINLLKTEQDSENVKAIKKFLHRISDEPKRTGRFADFVKGNYFAIATTMVIFCDQAVTIISTNHSMEKQTNEKLGWIVILEWIFLAVYTFEIACKFAVHRFFFFTSANAQWNIFDTLIVVYSFVSTTGLNLSFLRALRVLKLMKSLKALRALGLVDDLHLMVDSLMGCFFKFFWAVFLLAFILYIFALVFVQQAAGYIIDAKAAGQTIDANKLDVLDDMLGSVQRGIFSLFKCVTFGMSWASFREAVEYTGQLSAVMLAFFQAFWMISVMNIVTTVFLSRVIKVMQPSARDQLKARLLQQATDAGELYDLFQHWDTESDSGKGNLSRDELAKASKNEKLREFLAIRGIEIKNEHEFSKTVLDLVERHPRADKTQIQSIAEFCFNMRGSASTLDMHILFYELKTMQVHNQKMLEALLARENGVHSFANIARIDATNDDAGDNTSTNDAKDDATNDDHFDI